MATKLRTEVAPSGTVAGVSPGLLERLACPRDHRPLAADGDEHLSCPLGHRWPVVEGVPILLLADRAPTHPGAELSLAVARGAVRLAPAPAPGPEVDAAVDPFVQQEIAATNGRLYRPLIGRLSRYPIPRLPMGPGEGLGFVELGCNWGRWCLAAAQRGWRALGIDPCLPAVLAARRVARQLGLAADFVVADARFLPLAAGTVDAVFSYSVLQHLAKSRARRALAEAGRVLRPGGRALVQLPNRWGLRSLMVQTARLGRPAKGFDVRYWTPAEMRRALEEAVGPASLRVDGFFCLDPRPEDADLLPELQRTVLRLSESLRTLSERVPELLPAADSLWVEARRGGGSPEG